MKRTWPRSVVTVIAALLAVALLAIGAGRTHKVYEKGAAGFGVVTFDRIGDRRLVEEATFSGVVRLDSRLSWTHDRKLVRGKRTCPS